MRSPDPQHPCRNMTAFGVPFELTIAPQRRGCWLARKVTTADAHALRTWIFDRTRGQIAADRIGADGHSLESVTAASSFEFFVESLPIGRVVGTAMAVRTNRHHPFRRVRAAIA